MSNGAAKKGYLIVDSTGRNVGSLTWTERRRAERIVAALRKGPGARTDLRVVPAVVS